MELPPDITAVLQTYKVNCIIAGNGNSITLRFYYDDDNSVELTNNTCTTGDGFTCNKTLNIGDTNTGVSHLAYDITPNALRHGLLTVTWEAEEISSGVFRQDNNDGDHRIRCNAQRLNVNRNTDHITVRGSFIFLLTPMYLYLFVLAPASSPSGVQVTLDEGYVVNIEWTYYNANDADGFVVYYNNNVKKVEGGAVNVASLYDLIQGRKYTITVRAYQDILGPPSTPLEYTKG